MPTHSLDHARLTIVTRSFVSSSPMRASSSPAMKAAKVPVITRVIAREPQVPEQPMADTGKIGKGLAWALSLEAVAALAVYAAWHFVHVLHFHL